MSAICGMINLDGTPIDKQVLADFNYRLKDYGGDGANLWLHNNIGFGQQMSYLTTESIHEILPYYDENAQIAITADLFLFNRKELCTKLDLIDEITLSDSQIVIATYIKYGKSFAKHLLGEYSIVIWDNKALELICITDHFNNNPLYYYKDDKVFAFASNIDALNGLPQIKRSINFEKIALLGYFTTRKVVGETFFTNIKYLPAATIMTINANGNSSLQHYWQPELPEIRHFKSEDEFSEEFQAIFSRVITDATRTHLPICSLLSGGLDSSSITAMATHVLKKQNRSLTSFSAVLPENYEGNVKDESYYINLLQVSNLTKLNIIDKQRGPFDNLSNFTSTPQTTSRHYLYHAFNDKAREIGAKIILDGCYGEIAGTSYWSDEYLGELFRKFQFRKLIHNIQEHRRLFNRSLKSILFHDVLQPNLPQSWQHKLKTRKDLKYIASFSLIRTEFFQQYISQEQLKIEANKLKNIGTKPSTDGRYNNFLLLQWLIDNKSPNNVINEQGKPVIRYRYPFLDKRIIEFCLSLPNEFRYKNGYRRYIIRRGMHNIMPSELCYRTSKEPFSPDYHNRYKAQIIMAKQALESFKNNSLVQEVLDLKRLDEYINLEMESNRCYTKNDFIGMQIVPQAMYLASFLVNNS